MELESHKKTKLSPEQKTLAKIAELEKITRMKKGLPFLHGWKWYTWAREFFESTNKINLLCAANQISKSSTQIRKCLDWATNQPKWDSLWGVTKPTQFWYLYPTLGVATIEFEKKWSQFLPRDEYKNDPVYGWKSVYHSKEIHAIHFNSGVSVYFKSYKQNPADLQTGTCDAIFCDEELPEDLYDELMLRLSASDGYFHMVFTATLGQEFWRQVLEPEDFEDERLKGAYKKCVSMYECMIYEDGTPSHWTKEKIQMVVDRCKDRKAVLKRVFGRFVRDDEGLKYEQFQIKKHLVKAAPIPADWFIYGGVDIGSGGKGNHPAAIVFLAVRPDYQAARVFLAWRGDGVITTAGDVMNQFIEMEVENKLVMAGQYYDWGSIDFTILVERLGKPFIKADKSHIKGEEIMSILFKNDMLLIYDTPEGQKLAAELIGIRKEQPKNKLKDDLTDALRYIVTSVPWDFDAVTAYTAKIIPQLVSIKTPMENQIDERREFISSDAESPKEGPESEIAEWNEAYYD